jgi:ketosteroid isomerase-like protein
MIKLLAEQPLTLSILLGLAAAALVYGWLQTGSRPAGVGGLVMLALIPVAWVVAAFWETEEERLRATCQQIARAVEANQRERLLDFIHPDATEVRRRAEAALPRAEFSQARIGSYRSVEIFDELTPNEAIVDLTGSVVLTVPQTGLVDQRVAQRAIIRFRKSGEDWRVVDYQYMSPVGPADGLRP